MARSRSPSFPPAHFVIDSSIVAAWYFDDESDGYADAVAASLASAIAVVPSIFHLEIANILIIGERRKRGTEAKAAAFLSRLSALPFHVDGQTTNRAWSDTMALARAHGLTSYDAAYLELCLRESLPLASLDRDLKAAAKAVGVPFFTP
jgi:predicted nucleic acid-binding protein